MKIKKGYHPKFIGRPASDLIYQEVVSPLQIPLVSATRQYSPLVKAGESVKCGQALAKLEVSGGDLSIAAAYEGTVTQVDIDKEFIKFNVSKAKPQAWSEPTYPEPAVLADSQARQLLADAGIWPTFWDSAASDTPALDAPKPRAIVVRTVCCEPFRARGNVILGNNFELFAQGLGYLERLSNEFAPIYVIFADAKTPLTERIRKELLGLAWLRPIYVPSVYPISNNRYLWRYLRQNDSNLHKGDSIWFLDTQAVVDIARCLGQGLVPSRRIVTVGGPGYPHGQHISVPIGTALAELCSDLDSFENLRVLRGGIFTGQAVDPCQDVVGHLDDGFTFLPEGSGRQFLSFMRAGFDKPSYTSAYLSGLRAKKPLATNTSLRGEPRACIACGYCEDVCPVDIMPHLIWRFLQKDLFEEAQMAGAQICVECGLCSYVCPSKIELADEISKGIKQIHEELLVEAEKQEADV